MRIVLTGATGFVGSHILDSLLQEGAAVKALVLPETLAELGHRGEVKVILGSLLDNSVLARATAGVDLIIHSAAKILGSTRPDLWAVNVLGTSNLLRAAAANCVPRFVYLSSTAVYSPPQFAFQLPITENSPLGPFGLPMVTDYGESKIEAERLILAFNSRYGMKYTIIRPTIAYGINPGAGMAAVELFLNQVRLWSPRILLSGPSAGARMQWVHVKDLAAAVVDAAILPAGTNQIFNISGSEAFTIRTVAQTIQQILHPLPINWLKVSPPLIYDISKAQRLLAYRPRIDLRTGIAEILQDLQRRGYFIPPQRLGWCPNPVREAAQTGPYLETYYA